MMILRIKKIEYPRLWEEDKNKSTYFNKPEGIAIAEAVWRKPDWVKESKKAGFWLPVYKISAVCCFLFPLLPVILALFGIFVFN